MKKLAAVLVVIGSACSSSSGGGAGGGGGSGGGKPAPAPTVTLIGKSLSFDVFRAIVPAEMTATVFTDAAALDKVSLEKVVCRITLWPPVPATGDLDAQALAILESKFPLFGGIRGIDNLSPLSDSVHTRGVSGEGWRFVELQGELLNQSNGQGSGQHVRILAAELGTQVAAMIGWQDSYYPTSTDYRCIYGEVLDPYEWTAIVYSLSFPSYAAPNPHALRDGLVGAWFGATSGQYISLVWNDVFSGNGRHSDLIGYETWQTLNATQVLDTFSTWQGNGQWAVNGNLLTIWPDDPGMPATTRYFRVYQEVNSSEPTGWRTDIRKLGTCDADQHYCEGWANKE